MLQHHQGVNLGQSTVIHEKKKVHVCLDKMFYMQHKHYRLLGCLRTKTSKLSSTENLWRILKRQMMVDDNIPGVRGSDPDSRWNKIQMKWVYNSHRRWHNLFWAEIPQAYLSLIAFTLPASCSSSLKCSSCQRIITDSEVGWKTLCLSCQVRDHHKNKTLHPRHSISLQKKKKSKHRLAQGQKATHIHHCQLNPSSVLSYLSC